MNMITIFRRMTLIGVVCALLASPPPAAAENADMIPKQDPAATVEPLQSPPQAAKTTGPKLSIDVLATFAPEFHRVLGGPHFVDPKNDLKVFFRERSRWIDFDALVRVQRNENAPVTNAVPLTLFTPVGAYVGAAWFTVHATDWLDLTAGKFHGKFGINWLITPYVFFPFSQDYEQVERIGGGFAVRLPPVPVLGSMVFSAQAFYADVSSFLSATRNVPFPSDAGPPYLRIPKGYGPASTGRLNSYTFDLRSGNPFSGFFWQISATQEPTGYSLGRTEQGILGAIVYNTTLPGGWNISTVAEVARLTNYDGLADLTYKGINAGLGINHDVWTLNVIAGLRQVRGLYSADDSQLAVSLIRALPEILEGLRLGAGVEHLVVSRHRSWSPAPFVQYHVVF